MDIPAAVVIFVARNAVIAKFKAEIVLAVAMTAFSILKGFKRTAGDGHEGAIRVDALDEEFDGMNVITRDISRLKSEKIKDFRRNLLIFTHSYASRVVVTAIRPLI